MRLFNEGKRGTKRVNDRKFRGAFEVNVAPSVALVSHSTVETRTGKLVFH